MSKKTKRTKTGRPGAGARWKGQMRRVFREAAGVFALTVWLPEDLPLLLGAACSGHPVAQRYADAIEPLVRAMAEGQVDCLGCGTTVDASAPVIVMVNPQNDAATTAVGMVLCPECGQGSRAEIGQRAMAWWGKTFGSNPRKLEVSTQSGQA